MADPDRLITFLQLEHEERFLGYKESFPWDELKQKITKTAMGMANIRNGSYFI